MKQKISWVVGGEAGQGIASVGQILTKFYVRNGYNTIMSMQFPSLIRGGHNYVYATIKTKEKALAPEQKYDIIGCLNKETWEEHKKEINENGAAIYDPKDFQIEKIKNINLISVPFSEILKENNAKPVMKNTIMIGTIIALTGHNTTQMEKLLREQFEKKGETIVKENIEIMKKGYEYIKKNYTQKDYYLEQTKKEKNEILINGNEAIALGAIRSGCKFVSGYPMTPATSILQTIAKYENKYGIIVKHTEDEISAAGMQIGAWFAGTRALTPTSGGGISLMIEMLGLAGMTETPMLIINAQRGSPSTGLPTRNEQGDLKFLVNAGHGEFPRMVIAPGNAKQCFELTGTAFNITEKYQTPVIMLTDKYIANTYETEELNQKNIKVERGKILTAEEIEKKDEKTMKRYEFNKDGISPRWFPGNKGVHRVTGNEHDEFGRISEDPINREKMMEKRMTKLKGIKQDAPKPIIEGNKQAELLIITWGSPTGTIQEAINNLSAEERKKVALMQIITLHPIHEKEIQKAIDSAKRTMIVEYNYSSQLGKIIQEEALRKIDEKYLRITGREFTPEEMINKIKQEIKKIKN